MGAFVAALLVVSLLPTTDITGVPRLSAAWPSAAARTLGAGARELGAAAGAVGSRVADETLEIGGYVVGAVAGAVRAVGAAFSRTGTASTSPGHRPEENERRPSKNGGPRIPAVAAGGAVGAAAVLADASPAAASQLPSATTTVTLDQAEVATVAGTGADGDADGPGTEASFRDMRGTVAADGFLYVSTKGAVRRIDTDTGAVTTLAGISNVTGCTNSTDATLVRFGVASEMTSDGTSLYLACGLSIRKVDMATGATTTLTSFTTSRPIALTVGGDGKLYVGVGSGLWRVDPATSAKTQVATLDFDDLGGATSMTADATELWIYYRYRTSFSTVPKLKRVDLATYSVTNVWSPGSYDFAHAAVVSAGDYVYASDPLGRTVRRFAKSDPSTFVPVAGTNAPAFADGTGTDAWFGSVAGLATDGTHVWAADATNRRIRRLAPGTPLPAAQSPLATTTVDHPVGRATTFAGNGVDATVDGLGTSASFRDMRGTVVVGNDLYVLTAGAIRKVSLSTGAVTTFAGHATATGTTDNVDPTLARFGSTPYGITTDGYYLYVGDSTIRRVSLATGATSTVTGGLSGPVTFGPDGFLYAMWGSKLYRVDRRTGANAVVAELYDDNLAYRGMAADADAVWIAMLGGPSRFHIKRVSIPDYTVTIAVDVSPFGSSSWGLASAGDYLYTTAMGSPRLRRYTKSDGTWIDIVGTSGSGNVDADSTDAWFGSIPALAADGTNLWVADAVNRRIRKVTTGATPPRGQPHGPTYDLDVEGLPVVTVAGNGDDATVNGPLGTASFKEIGGMVQSGTDVYVSTDGPIRKVDPATGVVTSFAGLGVTGGSTVDSTDPSQVRFTCFGRLASDRHYLYTACNGTYLRRTALATGATSTLTTWSSASITVGPDGLVYVGQDRNVVRVDPSTGAASVLATVGGSSDDVPTIAGMAADAEHIWLVYLYNGPTRYFYHLIRVRLTDGQVTTMNTNLRPTRVIASAGRYVYLASSTPNVNKSVTGPATTIERYDKATGTGVRIAGTDATGYVDGIGDATRFNGITALASDGTTLWIADSGNRRLRAISLYELPVPGDIAFGDDGYGAWTEDVNGGLGNFVDSVTDASVSTPGPDLSVTRTYNSRETRAGPFGVGWTFPYGTRWSYLGEGVVVTFGDGRSEYHRRRLDGTFEPPTGYFSELTPIPGGGFTLTEKDRTVHRFRPDGKLQSITDSDGRRLDVTYDAAGKLLTVADASGGRSLTFAWNGSSVESVSTAPVAAHGGALTWRYYYTGDKLTRACDPRDNTVDGSCLVYTWTGNRITRITRPKGNTQVELDYLADGRVDKRRNGAGDQLDFDYPSTGVVDVTDGRGNTTRQTYDSKFRLVSETDAAGKVTTHAYDTRGNRTSTTDANLTTTTFAYDSRGNVTSVTDGETKTKWFTYDGNDLRTEVRDARSSGPTDNTYRTTTTYDADGNPLTETSPPTADFPGGVTKSWTYTTGGEPVPGGTMPPGLLRTEVDERGKVTTHSYNVFGDRVETVDPVGLRTVWGYDEIGRKVSETVHSDVFPAGVTTTTTYDQLDNPLVVTGPLVLNAVTGASSQLRTTKVYDENENVVEVREEDTQIAGSQRVTEMSYDAADRELSVKDAEGGTLSRTYDAAGNVVEVEDQLGRVTRTTYDNRNLPTVVTLLGFVDDPVAGSPPRDVVLTQTGYDAVRRKETETDALGRTRRTTYDRADRVTTVVLEDYDNRDGTTRDVPLAATTYDPDGRPLTETRGGIRTVAHAYDAAGRRTTSTLDPGGLGRVSAFSYDEAGNLVRRTLTGGGRTEEVRFAYDDGGRRTRREVEKGADDLVTTYAYDRRDNVLSVTSPRGNAPGAVPAQFTTTYDYDELSRRIRTTSPPVAVAEGGVAPTTASPFSETGYDAFGDGTHVQDGRGAVTTTGYDKLGRRKTITHPYYTQPGAPSPLPTVTETFSYDAAGNLTSRTDRRGFTFDFHYDKRNRVVRQSDPLLTGETARGEVRFAYDDADNRTRRVDQNGSVTRWAYDDLDRARTETVVVAGVDRTTTFDYDDLGNRTYERDPLGHETHTEWSPASEPTVETDALDEQTTHAWDVAGRRTETVDPLGRKVTTEYDLAGRAVAERRYAPGGALLTTASYGYDRDGNRTSSTTPRGKTTTFAYDAAGRVTSVVEPVSSSHSITTSYGWDAAGNSTRIVDGKGNVTRTTYNVWNLPESTVEPATAAHPAAADRTWTTTYDAGGLPVREDQPGGVVVTRSFDNLGRLTTESGTGGGAPGATRTFGWDKGGRRTSVSHPAGTVSFAYDERGLMTSATGGAGSSSFVWDAAGRMTARADAAGTTGFTWSARDELATATDPLTGVTRTYGRDDAGQVTSVSYGSGNASRTLVWDDLGRLASDTMSAPGGGVRAGHAYGYDKDGNVTTQTVDLAAVQAAPGLPGLPPALSENPAEGTHAYSYDDAGRLTSWTAPGGTMTAYGWDDAGNRTTAGSETYAYDERNRLTSGPEGDYAWTPRGTLAGYGPAGLPSTTTFTHDALGRLVDFDGTVTYTYDGLDRVATRNLVPFAYAGSELDPVDDGSFRYGRSPDGSLLALADGTGAHLVGTNRHGDLAYLFGADGTLVNTRVWEPFGEPAGEAGTVTPPVGFQSDWTDPLSGDVWMGARWYSPDGAHFTARDTVRGVLETPVSLNRYTYANGDPLSYFDPDGRFGFRIGGFVRRAAMRAASGTGMRFAGAAGRRARSAANALERTSGVHVQRKQQRRVLAGTDGLYAPDGWDSWPGPKKTAWMRKHDRTIKNMKLANPWDVKQMATNVKHGAGVLKGIGEFGVEAVKGGVELIDTGVDLSGVRGRKRQRQTWQQVQATAKAIRDDPAAVVRAFTDPIVEDWKKGNYGEAIGRGYAEGFSTLFGVTKLAGAAKASKATRLSKVDDAADVTRSSRRVDAACTANSFLPGTGVLMADGTTKAIAAVREGDVVLAADPETGERGPRPVTGLIVGEGDKRLVDIGVDGEVVTATAGHPFWLPRERRWADADDLKPGDALLVDDGDVVDIDRVSHRTERSRVHNLTVAGLHTYHVLLGDGAVLVHNCSPLTRAEQRKLGTLAERADEKAYDVLRDRGGGATNVRGAGLQDDMGQWTLRELAHAAKEGSEQAEQWIKMVKQAGSPGKGGR